jgi:hypothetical protein
MVRLPLYKNVGIGIDTGLFYLLLGIFEWATV